MTRRQRLLLPLLALLLVGGAAAPTPWAGSRAASAQEDGGSEGGADRSPTEGLADGTDLKEQYDEVLGDEAKIEAAADQAALRRAALLEEIAGVQRQLDVTRLQLADAAAKLRAAVAVRDRTRRALRAAERRLDAATEQLHAQAVSSYVTGGTDREMLAVVVGGSHDLSATGRTLSYADAVVDHQKQVITEFKAARRARDRLAAKAETTAKAATKARDGLAGAQDEQEDKQQQLLKLASQEDAAAQLQQQALMQLRGRKVEIEARVVSLEKESDSIGILLAARQKDQPSYTPGSIAFVPPLDEFELGSPFGMRMHPILHYERLHAGADLSAPSGTPIRAAANGTVVLAEVRGGYGNCVVIAHGKGIATLYGHQSKLLVKAGDKVKAGDIIGAVGSTGLSTGPHLHFETRVKGVPVDPTNFIDLEAASEAHRAGG